MKGLRLGLEQRWESEGAAGKPSTWGGEGWLSHTRARGAGAGSLWVSSSEPNLRGSVRTSRAGCPRLEQEQGKQE